MVAKSKGKFLQNFTELTIFEVSDTYFSKTPPMQVLTAYSLVYLQYHLIGRPDTKSVLVFN